MNAALGQLPDEPGIDRAEREFAGFGDGARARNILQKPGDLAGREVRIDEEAGTLLDKRTAAIVAKAVAEIGGAAILPDDRVVNGLSCFSIPEDRRLALIGNSDRGDVAGLGSSLRDRVERHRDLRRSDLLGIVFDPAGLRIDLLKFPLGNRAHSSIAIK